MADGVELDPGSGGAIVLTDETAAGHAQVVKLAYSADASSTLVGADANGVDVDVTRLPALAAGTNNIGDVDVLTVPADPFGANADSAATAGSTGSIQAKLRLMTSQLDAIKTAVEIIDNSIAGSETQVDVITLPALPAGTNNIGDVDVLTLPGSLAGVADDAAFTVGTTPVLPAGFLADQTSTDSVNEGDVGAARMTLDRKIITTLAPSVDTEGATPNVNTDVDETEDAVKTSAGKLLAAYGYNDGASEVYLKFYNDTVANVTVGTTAPFMTLPIPAGSAFTATWGDIGGIPFSAAITIAATTGAATADTGAPATGQVVVTSLYV